MSFILALFFLLFVKPETVAPAAQPSPLDQRYLLKPDKSRLTWKANYLMGGGHEGTIQFESGQLLVSPEGDITHGDFVINLLTITNTDQKDEQGRRDLEEHLRSEDFFAVNQFPKSLFSITSVKPVSNDQYMITGYLSIKGIINLITFPATVKRNGSITASAKITIDRTRWGVTYQSKTIFSSLKDGIISDDITILLELFFERG